MTSSTIACCDWMQGELAKAGEKGFSVVALRDGDFRRFYVQARPFTADVVEKYCGGNDESSIAVWPELSDSRGASVPYVISMDLAIRYCPGCGTNLEKFIKKNKIAFDALAETMGDLTS